MDYVTCQAPPPTADDPDCWESCLYVLALLLIPKLFLDNHQCKHLLFAAVGDTKNSSQNITPTIWVRADWSRSAPAGFW